jgi:hypothetical protein
MTPPEREKEKEQFLRMKENRGKLIRANEEQYEREKCEKGQVSDGDSSPLIITPLAELMTRRMQDAEMDRCVADRLERERLDSLGITMITYSEEEKKTHDREKRRTTKLFLNV